MSQGYGLTPFHLILKSCFSHTKLTLKSKKWEKQEYTDDSCQKNVSNCITDIIEDATMVV